MKVEYTPAYSKQVTVPESFFVCDPKTKIGLEVRFGRAELVAWSDARQQFDGRAFYGQSSRLTPELLVSLLEAYKNRASNKAEGG